VAGVAASGRVNAWGWWYDTGAPISYERRVNLVAQMLTNGFNTALAAAFVKCSQRTVQRWWRRWRDTGSLQPKGTKRGPEPILHASALLYLLVLSEQNRSYQLFDYQERLKYDIGVDASEVRICVGLKKLGQHRKGASTKKIEGQTPHARLLYQRYFVFLLSFRLQRGPGAIHDLVMIDEMYLNLDDTKAKKARARNGAPAQVLDFDSRGKKYGQLAAVCTTAFFAQFVYPCNVRSTTRDLFEWWLMFVLGPLLVPGKIVCMDRASFHDPRRTATILSYFGCGLLLLAPYASDTNAIEYVHHVQKCYLRRNVAYSRAFPMSALYVTGSMIQPAHCHNLLHHVARIAA